MTTADWAMASRRRCMPGYAQRAQPVLMRANAAVRAGMCRALRVLPATSGARAGQRATHLPPMHRYLCVRRCAARDRRVPAPGKPLPRGHRSTCLGAMRWRNRRSTAAWAHALRRPTRPHKAKTHIPLSECAFAYYQFALRLGGRGIVLGLYDLDVTIVAAVLAYVVAQLHMLATRASHDTGSAQLPVSAAAALARFGYFSLRYCHCLHLLVSGQQIFQCSKRLSRIRRCIGLAA